MQSSCAPTNVFAIICPLDSVHMEVEEHVLLIMTNKQEKWGSVQASVGFQKMYIYTSAIAKILT